MNSIYLFEIWKKQDGIWRGEKFAVGNKYKWKIEGRIFLWYLDHWKLVISNLQTVTFLLNKKKKRPIFYNIVYLN